MAGRIVDNSNRLAPPVWMADLNVGREHLELFPAKVDWTQFDDDLGVLVKLSAAALAAATSISVDALSAAVPAYTLLRFGSGKYAYTTADAAAGATSISVEALPAALADNDEARYSKTRRRLLKSGTLIGRTYTERDASTGFGPADDTDDEIYLVAFDVEDIENNPDVELYRHGSRVKENYLPDWDAISADANLLAALRSKYKCFKGED